MLLCPPMSTLFPYTTLFRSSVVEWVIDDHAQDRVKQIARRLTLVFGQGLAGALQQAEAPLHEPVNVGGSVRPVGGIQQCQLDRKSTRLNSSHANISYAVFCLNVTVPTDVYTLSLHDALPI